MTASAKVDVRRIAFGTPVEGADIMALRSIQGRVGIGNGEALPEMRVLTVFSSSIHIRYNVNCLSMRSVERRNIQLRDGWLQ